MWKRGQSRVGKGRRTDSTEEDCEYESKTGSLLSEKVDEKVCPPMEELLKGPLEIVEKQGVGQYIKEDNFGVARGEGRKQYSVASSKLQKELKEKVHKSKDSLKKVSGVSCSRDVLQMMSRLSEEKEGLGGLFQVSQTVVL